MGSWGLLSVCVIVARPLDPFGASGTGKQVFNNADSFAQAFDEAWKQHEHQQPDHGLSSHQKRDLILGQLNDHPFQQSAPEMARQVADFRLRLLGL
jgi:hypothetical protein